MKNFFHGITLSLACVILMTGCSVFSPVKNDPPNRYMLDALPYNMPHYARKKKTILVTMPETRPGLDTTQMAYTTQPFKTAYFSQNQWLETPSQMLLPLIVQTLQESHAYRAVVTPPYTGHYDYLLTTQVNQLEQSFIHKPAMLQFSVRAQLINMNTNRVVATREMNSYQPIRTVSPYNGVIAANLAVATVLHDLAVFCHAHT